MRSVRQRPTEPPYTSKRTVLKVKNPTTRKNAIVQQRRLREAARNATEEMDRTGDLAGAGIQVHACGKLEKSLGLRGEDGSC